LREAVNVVSQLYAVFRRESHTFTPRDVSRSHVLWINQMLVKEAAPGVMVWREH
jgi:hypothetical protein